MVGWGGDQRNQQERKQQMKNKKDNWFDSHMIIMGDSLSEKDREFIKDSIIKKCTTPVTKLGGKKKKATP